MVASKLFSPLDLLLFNFRLAFEKYVQGTRKTNICFAFRLFVDQECVRFKQYLL